MLNLCFFQVQEDVDHQRL